MQIKSWKFDTEFRLRAEKKILNCFQSCISNIRRSWFYSVRKIMQHSQRLWTMRRCIFLICYLVLFNEPEAIARKINKTYCIYIGRKIKRSNDVIHLIICTLKRRNFRSWRPWIRTPSCRSHRSNLICPLFLLIERNSPTTKKTQREPFYSFAINVNISVHSDSHNPMQFIAKIMIITETIDNRWRKDHEILKKE